MSAFTIYVPGHVGRSNIQSCPLDAYSTFVDIDSEAFDIEAKLKEHGCFIMLDNDYFVAYQKQHPEGVKCNYRSRNIIMSQMRYGDMFRAGFGTLLKEESGVWAYEQPPVLYFIFGPDKEDPASVNGARNNEIAEFYDAVEEEDFEKFAQVAKTKNSCVSHFFVVSRGFDYHAVDASNPSVSYKFRDILKYKIINDLAAENATIQDFITEDENLHTRKPPTERDPDFQLRDNKGIALNENETFRLVIYKPPCEEDSDDDESDYEVELEYVDTYQGKGDCLAVLHGAYNQGAVFGFKVVDNITYLTHKGGYVCVNPDQTSPEVIAEPMIPPKERRVCIHYAEDGNIRLSEWNGGSYAYCKEATNSYSNIYVIGSEDEIRWKEPMKLVIVRTLSSE